MGNNPKVKCPTCGNQGKWFESANGPFCSKRCRLLDLGKWFGEENKISEPLRPDHFEGLEEIPEGLDPDRPT